MDDSREMLRKYFAHIDSVYPETASLNKIARDEDIDELLQWIEAGGFQLVRKPD